ncbi:MAG: Fe-S-containing protein [Coriobacteriales bacterium]|jgi:uncharacterized membrane protein|nr:Fe-S-containing protein [Coriobacteriales bacterium]
MLTYLIQVVQNSLTPGIILAMLFALAQVSGKLWLKRWLLAGTLVGVAAALVLSVLKATTVWINRELWSIGILSAAILATILFYLLAWGLFAKRAPVFHERLWSIASAVIAAALLLYSLPDIFLYPTDFVLPGESIFGTDFLFKMIGYLIGLLLVILATCALYKVASQLSFKLLRILLTIALALNLLNQLAVIAQFLLARRVIPMTKWLFDAVVGAINYNVYFLYAIMALTVLVPIILLFKRPPLKTDNINSAQRRRHRAHVRSQRRWCGVVLAGFLIAVFTLTAIKAYDEQAVVLSPAEPMNIVGSQIVIPLEHVNDGHLHRFIYTASGGTEVRFIVIKKNEVAFGVGLDACDICGPTGYYERGDKEVICKLCDVVMNIQTIGFKGGCNPVPLAYTIKSGTMVIETQDLEAEKTRFE